MGLLWLPETLKVFFFFFFFFFFFLNLAGGDQEKQGPGKPSENVGEVGAGGKSLENMGNPLTGTEECLESRGYGKGCVFFFGEFLGMNKAWRKHEPKKLGNLGE